MLNPLEFDQVKHVIYVQAKKLSKGNSYLEEELISEGFLGLAEGIRTHNPERSALKTWCISMSKWAQFEYLSGYISEHQKKPMSKTTPEELSVLQEEALMLQEKKEDKEIVFALISQIKEPTITDVHISIFKEFLNGTSRKELAKKYNYTTAGIAYTLQNITDKVKELL